MVGILTTRPALTMAEEVQAMNAAADLAAALRLSYYAADEAPNLAARQKRLASEAFDRILEAYGLQVVTRPAPIDASDAARRVS
jgi:selenocysteine lyase/cysteine desulfurase